MLWCIRADAEAHSGDSGVSNTGGWTSFIQHQQVPVIVAEIGAQRVDIQDQSHGAAQQFCEHFSVSHTRGGWGGSNEKNNNDSKKKNNKIKSKQKRCEARQREGSSEFPISLFSPRLCQDVFAKTSPAPPPSSSLKCTKWIIHKVAPCPVLSSVLSSVSNPC